MNVTGVIFAGGYGKRLMPLTSSIPKPLLEIKEGYTILDKQIFDLKYAGIKKVYLLVGYLADKIKERYGDSFEGVDIVYLIEEKPMGTLWALKNAIKHIKTDIVLRNGDVVCDINIKNLINAAQKTDDLLVIALTKMKSPYGIVEFADRKVVSFREKPMLDLYMNAGIYYIKKEAFPYIRKKYDKKAIEHTVFQELVEQRKVLPYHEDGVYWQSVDGMKDLSAVRTEYENREDKPWGYERIIVNSDKYLVKEFYLKKGFTTSVHLHPNKDESMHILEGDGYIEFTKEKKRKSLAKGKVVRIKPNVVHSIVATENLKIYEYSTPHPKDTIRVRDFYGRRCQCVG